MEKIEHFAKFYFRKFKTLSQIEEIKSKLDIVNVIREYVPNLKRGGRNFFALCPFHSEKSPSFSVNEEIQRYKCFGCGESGDVITFIQKFENLEFPQALEIAARKAGVELKKENFNQASDKTSQIKNKIYEVNKLAAEYYHYILMKHESGDAGRKYANERRLGKNQIEEFQIGFAPDGFNNLKNFLVKKGYQERDLIEWSLLTSKNGNVYDKFRNRLMFPIFDTAGNIVGFSGRVIRKDDIPKYLNSNDTLVYHKSDILYGLYQAKESIRKIRFVILVEGNVDVPMAHKFEIKNIVAPMGTALTEQQLKLLKRYSDMIYFAYDNDDAGEKALFRAFEMAEKQGIKSKAINVGECKDLDELLKLNVETARNAIENASTVVNDLMRRWANRLNISTAEGKSQFTQQVVTALRLIQDEVERAHYVQQTAERINIDEKIIWNYLNKSQRTESKVTPRKSTEGNEASMNEPHNHSGLDKECHAIAFLLEYPELREKETDFRIFEDKKLVELYKKVIEDKNIKEAISKLENDDEKALLTDILLHDLGNFESVVEAEHFYSELIREITIRYYKSEIKNLRDKIKEREVKGEDYDDLLSEMNVLSQKLKK